MPDPTTLRPDQSQNLRPNRSQNLRPNLRLDLRPDLRLVPATMVAWVAVWWATGQSAADVAWALGVALLVALGAMAGLFRRGVTSRWRRWREWLPAIAMLTVLLVLELAGTCLRLSKREADPLTGWAAQHRTVTITGRVSADSAPIASRFPGSSQRWVAQVAVRSASSSSLTEQDVRHGPASVVVIGAAPYAHLVAGQQVEVRGRLSPADRGDKAIAVLSPRSGPVLLSDGGWIWRAANRLRSGLREACAGLPERAGGLLPALVVGDTSRLPTALTDDLRAAGLTHLTAVSGANLVILGTAVSGLCAAAGLRTRARVLACALSIAGFVVLARPEPSVLRAAVMAGLGLIGVLSSRPGRGIPLLSATALLLLLANPWLSRSFGFVLSVLATAGLLLLVPAWMSKAGGSAHRRPVVWRQVLVALVAVPVAALISTAPVTILLQPQLSAASVPANLLAEPAVPAATLLGVLAAVISPWWPGGAAALAHVGGFATAWIATVAQHGAAVPGAQIPWLPGVAGALILAVVLLIVVVLSLRPSAVAGHPPARPKLFSQSISRWLRREAPRSRVIISGGLAVILIVTGVIAGRAGLIPVPGVHPGVPDDWLVVQCDVGQGSATLLNTGAGRAIMVDTGPDPALASRCLRRQHIRSLDMIVITHFHADHAGGLAGALSGVLHQDGPPPILVSPFARPADQAASVNAAASRSGSTVIVGHAGLSGTSGGGSAVRWQLLSPSTADAGAMRAASASSGAAADDGTQINDSSLAMLVTVRGVRILLLGDLETDAQQKLLSAANQTQQPSQTGPASQTGPLGPVDVVVVAHHGSARQYPPLYARLDPRVALIGVGEDNDYGHPAPSALSMLRRLGVQILRTDTEGQLTVAGTATQLRVFTSR